MAHGGARPGAGRKAGGKNSTPARGVTSKSVCLPASYWDKMATLAERRETTTTKLAAAIIAEWLATR